MRVRRNTVEFGYRDSYDYTTIAEIIRNWLINYRKVVDEKWQGDDVIGIPMNYLEEAEASILDSKIDEKWELAHQNRLKDLDKMIDAWNIEEDEIEIDDYKSIIEWREAYKKIHERRLEGRILFAKEIESLWW